MRHSRSALLVASMLAFARPAAADDSERAFFVGVGGSYLTTDGIASSGRGRAAPTQVDLPLDGLPIDDHAGGWRVLAGWNPTPNWSLELDYDRFGELRSAPVVIADLLGNIVQTGIRAGLDVKSVSAVGSYRRSLGGKLHAAVQTGVSRAFFRVRDVFDFAPVFPSLTPPPLDVPPVLPGDGGFIAFGPVPAFAEPKDRTGWVWGVSVDYELTPRLDLALAYRRYDVAVVDIESVGLDLRWRF